MIGQIVAIAFVVLLGFLLLALVFSRSFRNEVLKSNGEATVPTLISAKGTAIVVLTALLSVPPILYLLREQPAPPTCAPGTCVSAKGECGRVVLTVGSVNHTNDQHANESSRTAAEGENVDSLQIKNGDTFGYSKWSCAVKK